MAMDDLRWLVGIAWRLDRLRWAPRELLTDIVTSIGACMYPADTDAPDWLAQPQPDRELAARICGGCPVQDECLELELRRAGEHTVGVWGAMTDDDRRELHWHWRQRGERATDEVDRDAPEGGRSL